MNYSFNETATIQTAVFHWKFVLQSLMSIIAANDWQVATVSRFSINMNASWQGTDVSVPCCAPHPIFTSRKMGAGGVVWGGINHQIQRKDNPSGPKKQSVAQSLPFFPHLYYRTTAFLCWEGSHNHLILLRAQRNPTRPQRQLQVIHLMSNFPLLFCCV